MAYKNMSNKMDKIIRTKYRAKGKDSFKTKKNLFLFQVAINDKATFSEKDFNDFTISEDLVKCYSTEYWQQPVEYKINGLEISYIEKKIESIEKENVDLLKQLEKRYVDNFSSIFPESEFEKLLSHEECHYCKITMAEIEKLGANNKLYKKSLRGWSFEIDRLNSNYEYKPDNCVMSCYWCNNAKTDEFTESEFLKIGKEIRKVWEERLK